MLNTIQMAKMYQTRPSKLLNIENDWLAYMIDEFSIVLENMVTDDKGRVRWDKVNNDKKVKDNKANNRMIEHIKSTKGR